MQLPIINDGEESNVTASFNNFYDGKTISPLDPLNGHIHDDTPITFSRDNGSLNPCSLSTVNGNATTTFKSDGKTANINAKTDYQQLLQKITSNNPPTDEPN